MARKNRGRGPNQQIRDAERRGQALALKRAGKTYDEIASALGLKYRANAEKIVKRALDELWVEPAEDVRKIEIQRLELAVSRAEESVERLDRLVAKYLPLAEGGDIDAADMVVKAESARAKVEQNRTRTGESLRRLLGLDAPEKHEHTGKDGGPIEIDGAHDDLLGRLARLAAIAAPGAGDPKPEPN